MRIDYIKDLSGITEDMLPGFFVGWQNPPSPATHLKILKNSYCAFVAIDVELNKTVGFINAVSDGVLAAYIPLLEVLPEYQGRGIGAKLVEHMLKELDGLYMIDICHDKELTGFYAKFGAHPSSASIFRNFAAQKACGGCPPF